MVKMLITHVTMHILYIQTTNTFRLLFKNETPILVNINRYCIFETRLEQAA